MLAEREDAVTKSNWFIHSSQAAVSYNWALIQHFSKYYALAVPLIDQSSRLSDNPRSGVIPVTLAGYMSSVRGVCLSNTKYELKFLILQKTSVPRDKNPQLTFERLKLISQEE